MTIAPPDCVANPSTTLSPRPDPTPTGFVENILYQRANAADFWYGDRLPGEPAGGVNDVHIHPIEPRTVRFTIAKTF